MSQLAAILVTDPESVVRKMVRQALEAAETSAGSR